MREQIEGNVDFAQLKTLELEGNIDEETKQLKTYNGDEQMGGEVAKLKAAQEAKKHRRYAD